MADDKKVLPDIAIPVTKIKDGEYQVSRQDYHAFLDKEGISEQVRAAQAAAQTKLLTSIAKFASGEVIAAGAPEGTCTVEVKGKDTNIRGTIQGVRTFPNPQDPKAPVTRYGVFTVNQKISPPLSMRSEDGVLAGIEADCRKAFAKKK